MDYSFRNLSNEDRLFLAVPPCRPAVSSYTVVGGRIVASSQGQFPVNGQQLMMQLDSLTSSMMEMNVSMDDEMEDMTEETVHNRESTQPNKDRNKSHQQQQHEQQMMQQQQYELQLQQYQLQQQQQFHQEQQHTQQLLPFSHKYLSLCNN
eukprot:TRINITY_DN11519_c0_g1_i2.p1 TRINITY_DN11519_c0_g1~~TRINITY_DN11519_c0_g1_i2.p1  ORF type:complete len:150 (-),score=49.72 TRINITY_DN11519_c0_g1_i2:65-514(-)